MNSALRLRSLVIRSSCEILVLSPSTPCIIPTSSTAPRLRKSKRHYKIIIKVMIGEMHVKVRVHASCTNSKLTLYRHSTPHQYSMFNYKKTYRFVSLHVFGESDSSLKVLTASPNLEPEANKSERIIIMLWNIEHKHAKSCCTCHRGEG